MRRLICTFVVHIWHKTRFRMTWPNYALLYDIVKVSLWLCQGFFTPCNGCNTMCWLCNCTNRICIATNTFYRETLTKSLRNIDNTTVCFPLIWVIYYFTYFLGRHKKKYLTTCKQDMAYLTWPELGPNPQRWDDKWFGALNISGLSHSTQGPPNYCYITGCVFGTDE